MIQLGDVINNYNVIQKLGDGMFGNTFEVKDRLMGGNKVIKVLKLSNFSDPVIRDKVRELFVREYDVLRELNHSGIPKVEEDGYLKFACPHTLEILHGLVMEKIEGQNLLEWLKQNQRIQKSEQVIDWLEQLIDILHHIHSQNYFHRDIKPENIMLKPDGQLVLIDFGAVKEFTQKSQKRTNPQTKIGTDGYQSPEQEMGKDLNFKSDFFSLGCTFVHLLTGTHPVNLEKNSQTGKLLWRHEAPQFLEEIQDLIDDLIEYDPRRRPENIQVILHDIKKIKKIISPSVNRSFSASIVFISFLLNIIFMTLLAIGFKLNLGWKVFFVIAIGIVGIFLFLPLI